ncbi:thiolase family protein [Pseudarthrobacter sp. GA104]|uniref:thiolase family protein n=1 Tax=Pseudarthrobacter sp. GA104 TaxID=2676311 RepID=UPI001381CF01|nr:thiolase family protein [Pseudarthrobacter sp. GA104]MUU71494.1 thiolase family protein [Pseudarthrobacter sp. GA104]
MEHEPVIAGVGVTAQGKLPGETNLTVAIDAFKRALDDCGLQRDDIDGLLTEPGTTEFGYALDYLRLGEALGINPASTGTMMQGGASAGNLIQLAAMAVQTGAATAVACVFGDVPRTGESVRISDQAHGSEEDSWDAWGATGAIAWSALSASRHMSLYGTTERQLAQVAVAARAHAARNPDAVMREPISVEDHLSSRWIAEPLRLLDCCLITDGGACVIVTSAERAKDLRQRPVKIAGMGQAFTAQKLGHPDWWYGPHQRTAVQRAYKTAGIGPEDVQVAQLYDNFTISTVMWAEHAGFCAVGEGGSFVDVDRIGPGGSLPINTHGGHLSAAHPEGWLTVIEGVHQVRGTAGERQVPKADVCLVTGRGMLLNCASALVLTK